MTANATLPLRTRGKKHARGTLLLVFTKRLAAYRSVGAYGSTSTVSVTSFRW